MLAYATGLDQRERHRHHEGTRAAEAGGTRQGWLVGLDRDIGKNFRIGAGYNFTEFSDDLTDFDYDHEGWFLNMVGMY